MIKICPICVTVSSIWLILSAGIAWDFLDLPTFIVPIALLMGGTVVGIAYQGEKKFRWAVKNRFLWKILVIGAGMSIAYASILNLNKFVVFAEISVLFIIAYFFFTPPSYKQSDGSADQNVDELKEKMKQCC